MKRTLIMICLGLGISACQDVEQPTVVLTQAQWADVQKHILSEEPQPKYRVGAKFEDKIELIGFDVSEPLTAGKPATFTWYWRALTDVSDNWKVFVHFDSSGRPFRQNLDHTPVKDLFPTSKWKKGNIIKDVQEVTMRSDWPDGPAIPYFGLYRADKRLAPTGDVSTTKEAQPRVIGPTLKVSGTAVKETPKPTYAVRIQKNDATTISVDGKLDEPQWDNIPAFTLSPLGNAPRTATLVKAFITEDTLYVGAQLDDKNAWGTLENRDDSTWTQEVFELFLDPDGDGQDYLELQITPQGTIFDANFKKRLGQGEGTREAQIDAAKAFNLEGLESKVLVDGTINDASDEDKGWTIEFKLPLSSIPGVKMPVGAGAKWAVNIYRFDRPDEKTSHAYGWSTAPRGDFHQVDKFGEWTFSSSDVAIPKFNPELMKTMEQNLKLRMKSTVAAPVQPSKLQELKNPSVNEQAPAAP